MANNAASVAKPSGGGDRGKASADQDAATAPKQGGEVSLPVKQIPTPSEPAVAPGQAKTEQPDPYKLRDLIAQEDMAYWAMGMFFAAMATFLVTSIGTFLIWRQVKLTRQAVEDTGEATVAMREANEIARDTAKRQLRAYVAPDHFDFNKIEPGCPLRLRLWIKNFGQTPAQLNNWQTETVALARQPVEGDFTLAKLPTPPSRATLGAQQALSTSLGKGAPYTEELITEIKAGTVHVFLFGVIEYLDRFGDQQTTHFRFELDPSNWHWFACAEGNEAT